MADENFSKNFFLAALLALVILAVVIIFPLITPILAAAIFTYLTYPIFKRLTLKLKSKRIAAGIIVLILVILVIVPSYFIANSLTREGYSLYLTAKQKLSSDFMEIKDCEENPESFCELSNEVISLMQNPQFKYYIEDAISKLASFIVTAASDMIVNIPSIILSLFVMFFMIYYFLIDGERLIEKTKTSVPLRSSHIDEIVKQFNNFTYATIYGNFITAFIQGTIGGLIFWILGIPTPIIAGLAMAFFAFLPVVGTPIVWVPVALALFFSGEIAKAIILLLLGTFVISTIDNVIKPEIIGKRTNLHPAAVLIGIIGGLYVMGIIGILIGPLILSLLISFIDVYYKERV